MAYNDFGRPREYALVAHDAAGKRVYWTGLSGPLLWANENKVAAYRMGFALARYKAEQLNLRLPALWQPWQIERVGV